MGMVENRHVCSDDSQKKSKMQVTQNMNNEDLYILSIYMQDDAKCL